MSVNMFENTSMALREIAEEIRFRTENPGSVDVSGAYNPEGFDDEDGPGSDLSSYEKDGLKAILQMALDIVENAGGTDALYEAIENFNS